MQARQYQAECLSAIFGYLNTHRGYDPATGQPVPQNPVAALPTGTGKAYIIAEIVRAACAMVPGTRIVNAIHSETLVRQNADEIRENWPGAPVGIYCAGLGIKQLSAPITVGSIGSLIKVADQMEPVQLLLIDEAHMLSPDATTMYQKFIAALQVKNPFLRVIGLTATMWRTGQGLLTNDGIFTDVVYNITGLEAFNRLIAQGYLAPLVTRATRTEVDVAGVGIRNGDYNANQLETVVEKVTREALREACEYGWNRRAWMVFAAGNDNADMCGRILKEYGVTAEVVHTGIPKKERKRRVEAFKRGEIRCIINNNVLTTGFNHPPVDMVIMLRPTMSSSLWVQMCGRATRPANGKTDALVLDFAGNIKRLGPINDPVIPKRRKAGEPGEMPVKICNSCGCYNHTRAPKCEICGADFEFQLKITENHSTAQILASDLPTVDWFDVQRVVYSMHSKAGKPPSMRVAYHCGRDSYSEWVHFENDKPFLVKKAKDWWRDRAGLQWHPPATVFEALQRQGELQIPRQVKVWTNKKPIPEVLEHNFSDERKVAEPIGVFENV